MNPKGIQLALTLSALMWGIIGSGAVLVWELNAPDTDPGLVKSMIVVIVCCLLIIALVTAIAVMDDREPSSDCTRDTPLSPPSAI